MRLIFALRRRSPSIKHEAARLSILRKHLRTAEFHIRLVLDGLVACGNGLRGQGGAYDRSPCLFDMTTMIAEIYDARTAAVLANPDIGVIQIAHCLGVSAAPLYRYIPAARTANTAGG